VKFIAMSLHARVIKNEEIATRPQAAVIPIRITGNKNSEQHGKEATEKAKKNIPFFYTRPIFKAKKHDPL
jgi:hypothetical protein